MGKRKREYLQSEMSHVYTRQPLGGVALLISARERKLRRRGCGLSVICGVIVRNAIFPDTLPYKYPYFSPFVLQTP